MGRNLIGWLALFITTVSAFADTKIDSAINVFKRTGADATKLMTFCAMSQSMEAAGDNEDATTKAKIDEYLKQLGPKFEAAWKVFRDADQDSPEGRALNQAVDELGGDCP